MRLRSRLVVATIMLVGLGAAAHAQTYMLTYRDANKWVAPADNAPLLALFKHAQAGQRHYLVSMPAQKRALSVARVEVLQTLLAHKAGDGVIVEEAPAGATPAANTLVVSIKK